ncbi:MAG: hypothetical protein JO219_08760 [Candidatus Eremiobacteraeota bacterium]|nr:hypothetical protein [Candidatus Eremiobacteraeota bacterium]MBV8365641.1 hypothetical protein [Candidatus Eremiobacteraeota bacterium]
MNRLMTLSIASALAATMIAPSMSLAMSGPQSDSNLRWAQTRVERDIDMLQRDQHDYDGHRVKAIEDFQDARGQLALALRYDRNHDYAMPLATPLSVEPGGWNRSDRNLAYVRGDIEQVIDVLQRDNHDYDGHRVDAIAQLQYGREQIDAALASDRGH